MQCNQCCRRHAMRCDAMLVSGYYETKKTQKIAGKKNQNTTKNVGGIWLTRQEKHRHNTLENNDKTETPSLEQDRNDERQQKCGVSHADISRKQEIPKNEEETARDVTSGEEGEVRLVDDKSRRAGCNRRGWDVPGCSGFLIGQRRRPPVVVRGDAPRECNVDTVTYCIDSTGKRASTITPRQPPLH